MAKKIKRQDTDVFNPRPRSPKPKYMNAKVYRKEDMVKTFGEKGGDMQVFIKKANPKPSIMKIIRREKLNKDILKNPGKYAKLS